MNSINQIKKTGLETKITVIISVSSIVFQDKKGVLLFSVDKEGQTEDFKIITDFVKKHFRIISSKQFHTLEDFLIKAELVYDVIR